MSDKAVLVGINNYKSISDLRGCINDVQNVRSLLVDEFGFPAQNVRTFTDSEVTKDRIRKQWRWLLNSASAGDRLVFHFSGHGSFTTDLDDDEPDGADELLCLWDMDWDNKQTYLLDDELREFTSQVPEGVYLTIILDSCHSGTATRMLMAPGRSRAAGDPEKAPLVDVGTSLARLAISGARGARSLTADEAGEAANQLLAPDNPAEDRQAVLARFVQPPLKVLETIHRAGVRRSLLPKSDERETVMNHVLLAGSEPTQTSADAFIDDDFHGAFSYNLCRVAREGGSRIDHQELIGRVREALSAGRFTQVPQLEPAGTAGPLFRGGRRGEDSGTTPGLTGGGLAGEVGRELLDVMREVRDLLRNFSPTASQERVAGSRALVYVHGICRHLAGYSNPWWQAMRPHLSAALREQLEANRREVLWSDLVTPERSLGLSVDPRQAEQQQDLTEVLRDVLEDRAQRESLQAIPEPAEGAPPEAAPRGAERAILGIPGLDCVDDFAKYLTSSAIRNAVQQRFLDVVLPLLERGVHVDVISHSWGTVVAYEALRRLDDRTMPGSVRHLFTVGSALSIVPVQKRLQSRDGRRPRHVQRWINLDARGDIVGGTLRGMPLAVDTEFLNLIPTGCDAFLGLVSPACAHSSYFQPGNRAVNRDIFAAFMER